MEHNGLQARRGDGVRAHVTTRHWFIIAVGFSVLVLYGLWAAYGAAPTSLQFLTGMESEGMAGMAQGGHGAGVGAMTPEEFHEVTLKFVEDLTLPDGSVRPTRRWMVAMAAPAGAHEDREDQAGEHRDGNETGAPIDVYLMAMQFSYTPNVLRLERGVPYRFRMMSMDVNHGASIHTGFAGHIMRRPAQTMSEMVMTFSEPGEYMIYCTVYCGAGHSQMKGKIIVD